MQPGRKPRCQPLWCRIDRKTLSCQLWTCHGRQRVAGFSSWGLENCFLPQSGWSEGILLPLSSVQLVFIITVVLITCWPPFLKTYFLKLAWCICEMYPLFLHHGHIIPQLFHLSTNSMPPTGLPLTTSWLVQGSGLLSPTLRPCMAPYCLERKPKNYRIKRQSWNGLKSFHFPTIHSWGNWGPEKGSDFPKTT